MSEHPSMKQLPPGEPIVGKTYRADGWGYVSTNAWYSAEAFQKLREIIGWEDHVIFAMTTNGGRARGQFLVSPEGFRRIEEHRRGQPDPNNPVDSFGATVT